MFHTGTGEPDMTDITKRQIQDLNVLDYKTQVAISGLPYHVQVRYMEEIPEPNRKILVDFLFDLVQRENAASNTKTAYAKNLLYLMRAVHHKPIRDITRDDILSYLYSIRKPVESDPKQRWISTHNVRRDMYVKFWKWLVNPELSAYERRKRTPDIVKDLPDYKKKERTNVEAKDLWTPQEDALFLSYCDDKRIQFYHMFALDTSCRPTEGLRLRIGDIKIKYAGQKQYAEVSIGRGGKTKSRVVPLIISLPFYKVLLASHPEPSNPQAYIFQSRDHKSRYKNTPMAEDSLNHKYRDLKKTHFPKLLERADITPEDKIKIQELLQKPWHPYIRRHTSLTEKAKILNEYSLRLHAGWTKTSKMVEVYTHELGGESSAMLLEAAGIKLRDPTTLNVLQPKICSNCNEPNRPNEQFCIRCKFALNEEAARKLIEEERAYIDERIKEQLGEAMAALEFLQNKANGLNT